MRNAWKVAKWEIKRNMKNKSFLIGLFLTPIFFYLTMIVISLFSDSEPKQIDVFISDEIGVIDEVQAMAEQNNFIDWNIHELVQDEQTLLKQMSKEENIIYVKLAESSVTSGEIPVFMTEDINQEVANYVQIFKEPVQQYQLEKIGLTLEQQEIISQGITIEETIVQEPSSGREGNSAERLIPGIFAGIVLFSIVMSGMMIFQSASQEKKDKLAEIILSSMTPNELMQGKIIGYFALGLIQVFVWIVSLIPLVIWKFDASLFTYLFVPELIILLFIAVIGYLLFAALFVGLGATIEDVSTSGNLQGMVLMLPFLPLVFISPILSDPNGLVAKVTSYIPFTSPAVLILRLSILETWPWTEIFISIVILLISVWLFTKLAGKIFKTGILLYGKNATPKEIWKWLWV